MRNWQPSQERAVALITTLILVSAVALITISVLTISRNEAQISGSRLSNTRADLAERAAFEEAKNLLLALTGNDQYLVSSVMERQGSPGGAGMRYTFISTPKPGSVTHVPLFAGGDAQPLSLSNLDETSTSALVDTPASRPSVQFSSSERTREIEAFGLTHLSEDGRLIPEDRFPETGLVEMNSDPTDKFELRYTWWAEDLEGYPNIDVVGGWTDYAGNENGIAFDFIRPGYSATDPRTIPADSENAAGLRIPNPNDAAFAWQFPKSFRGQQFTGQVAPGLSPREIILQPWATPEIPLRTHPFARGTSLSTARHWLSSGGSYAHTAMVKREHRFMLGFHDYLSVPHIPHNHGYADAGRPRYNLNGLVADRAVSRSGADPGIVEIIEANLEGFGTLRKGGFPPEESYLATIAANAIDYADPDARPTTRNNSENAGNYFYRGVDSYCPVNELFVKFQYDGYRVEDEVLTFKFSAEVFAEFWNTSNHVADLTGVTLDLNFFQDLRFSYSSFASSADRLPITADDIIRNAPRDVPAPLLEIPPNQFHVHNFGSIEWEVVETEPKLAPIEIGPTVQHFSGGNGNESVRISYRLNLPDENGIPIMVDSSGYHNRSNTNELGFHFSAHRPPLSMNDFFMRWCPGNNTTGRYTGGRLNGSFLGDPWMSYYAGGRFGDIPRLPSSGISPIYGRQASPGFRNFDWYSVEDLRRPELIRAQTRVRLWPDRGFETRRAPTQSPELDEELPTLFTGPAINATDPNKAPWRISNSGRFFSVTELGNLHDPVMWSSLAPGEVDARFLNQTFDNATFQNEYPASLSTSRSSPIHHVWGGGNTLRIGRPEHPLFDVPGARASQLLDLFQVGHPGTNLGEVPGSGIDLYETYDPRDHQPLPAASNQAEAGQLPFRRIYDERLHAGGIFQQRLGHLNINSVPTLFEIETLLRGPFASTALIRGASTNEDAAIPGYLNAAVERSLENSLDEAAIPQIARGLYEARPFYSPSHLARVLSELIRRHEAMPDAYNDAAAEETFARVFNTTSFSSRHFRIFTYGEVLPRNTEVVLSRSRKIYEVFMEPEHDDDGNLTRVTTRILSIRDL